MTPETAKAAGQLLSEINVAADIVAQLAALQKSGSALNFVHLRTVEAGDYSAQFTATAEETAAIVGGMAQIAQARLDALNAQLAAL